MTFYIQYLAIVKPKLSEKAHVCKIENKLKF